jgi:hypothetical protein
MEMAMTAGPRTDWLEHASWVHTCPLCTAAGNYDADYLLALSAQLVEDRNEQAVTAAPALCTGHTTSLDSVARRSGVSADTILAVHVARLEELSNRLEGLDREDWPSAQQCALCLARNEVVLLCAHRLLAGLEQSGGQTAELLERAGGLCAAHFATAWEVSSAGNAREELRRVQMSAVRRLIDAARARTPGDEFDDARAQSIAERASAIVGT